MWDFRIGAALALMWRTLPFLGLRLAVYIGSALGYLLITGLGAAAGHGIGPLFSDDGEIPGAILGGLAGFAVFGTFMYFMREYILYLVKAGHVAILVELMDGKEPPRDTSQIGHASAIVKGLFAESGILFMLDQLVKGVTRAITSLLRGLLTALPIPGASSLASMAHTFLRLSLGFMDELILARLIRNASGNPWESARESLVLYAQNHRVMLKNAAWLALFIYLAGFLVFLVMLIPAALLVHVLPATWTLAGLLIALLLTWVIKAALLEPLALTCLMQVYFDAIEGQQPDSQWDGRLDQLSDKFRKLKQHAWDGGNAKTRLPRAPAG